MPPEITSSPFLNLQLVNKLLSNTDASPLDPEEKIQLLSSKIYLLVNNPTQSHNTPYSVDEKLESELEILSTRLVLAREYMRSKLPDCKNAEGELGLIDGGCKTLLKKLKKEFQGKEIGNERQSSNGMKRNDEVVSRIYSLRIQALNEMIDVDESLGKIARAKRTRELVERLMKEGD